MSNAKCHAMSLLGYMFRKFSTMAGVWQRLHKSKMLLGEVVESGDETWLYSSCCALPCKVVVGARASQ